MRQRGSLRSALYVFLLGSAGLMSVAAWGPVISDSHPHLVSVATDNLYLAPPGPAGGSGGGTGGKDKPASRPATSRPKPKLVLKSFEATKADADKSISGEDGVVIWQFYIDNAKDKIPEAKAELAIWLQRAKDNAEKINNKWVGGDELDKLHKAVQAKLQDAAVAMKQDQMIQAIKALEDADKIYPNSYEVKFLLGYYSIWRYNPASPKVDNFQKGRDYFEKAIKLVPNSPEARANLGTCYLFMRKYKEALNMMHSAITLEGNKEFVGNMVWAMEHMPEGILRSADVKVAVEDCTLLAKEKGVGAPQSILIFPFVERDLPDAPPDENKRQGVIASGSGEIVSADGYIITNRHVAGAGDTLLVRRNVGSSDESQSTAEVLYIDDEQDLALIKIKSDTPLPYLKYAKYDNPPNGRTCYLLGYPLSFQIGNAIKITNGIVSAGINGAKLDTADVTISAKANHGNSGGPIVDEYGHIMAVLTLGLGQGTGGDVYGAGISSGRVRKFLAKHNVNLEAGEPSANDKKMDAEEIAAKCSPATVLIMIANTKK